ncbi:MAG: hypothetical protein GY778_19130, partial [bacterium]|nr:hypothetical protein [bacterium]
MRFSHSTNTIRVMTYSPTRDEFDTSEGNQFELEYKSMQGDFPFGDSSSAYTWVSGTFLVDSGEEVSTIWSGLQPNNAYEWYVEITDPVGQTVKSPKWHFATLPAMPTIDVTSPNGGESLTKHSLHLITWETTAAPDEKLTISLLQNGNWVGDIVSEVDAEEGRYEWITGQLTGNEIYADAGIGYQVKIATTAAGGQVFDSSDGSFEIVQASGDQPPFGVFATPIDGSEVSSSIAVTGWVLDDEHVASVKIYRNPVAGEGSNLVYIGDAIFVRGARPDIAAQYPDHPYNYQAGWGYMLLTNFLPGGNGVFDLYAIATDNDGQSVNLCQGEGDPSQCHITIDVDNQSAVKPFGAIDTPAQGGVASGSSFVVWGWALTPQPNEIPRDGSTITVWVDGVPLGHPTYNIYRSDIATRFPDYENSDGAVGYFYLDTTPYKDGVHTIAWSVTDDAGNTDGVGSRYFTIYNPTSGSERTAVDSDWDAFPDPADNCPQVYNPGQVDTDDDGVGDACEAFADSDGDGIADDGDWSGVAGDNPCTAGNIISCDDNCRTTANSDQADSNGDGVGDACTGIGIPAEITSPQPGSTLSGSTVTFQWNSGSGVTEYYLRVGSAAGSGDYFAASTGTSQSRQVSGLPTDGSTVHVRLSSRIDGSYQPRDYTYNTICDLTPPTVALFERTGEMTGGVPRTRIWGSRGITNTSAPGGTVAVGRASDGGEGSGYTAFRWQNGAFVGLPRAGGGPYASLSWAYGVSADGAVVYGYDSDAGAPVVWTDGGSGWADANAVTLSSGSGWGAISADGSVIVDDRAGVAYRYTTSDGWATAGGVSATVLGGMTAANGCSSDCSIVVGTDASGPAIYNGPSGTGAVSLPGAGEAFAVSDDGTVVAGVSPTNVYGQNEPCKWEYAGGSWTRTVLPLLPGMVPRPNKKSGAALAVAADGSRISGHFRADGDYYIPLVWEGGCVFELEDLLDAGGATVDGGWYLADLGAMSPDGRTFGGSMSDQPIGAADDNRHAWIATAGSFTDCNGNGVDDAVDVGNGSSEDCNGNGVPDECEPDSDGDGVIDDCDDCPGDPLKVEPGTCGCGIPDIDSDGDGVLDCLDLCPGDPLKIEPGACGCGVPDVDGNGNGIPDCQEGETTFQRIGEMAGGVPRTRIWGNRGVTNVLAGTGAIAVGRGNDGGEGSGYTAFRWQGGTFSGLPRAGSGPYSSHSSAYGISADGTVVYGYDFDAAAPAVWTDTGSGWANANTVTLNRGSGWGALAADGQTIVETQNGVAYKFTTSNGWATQGGIVRTTLAGMTAGLGSSSDGSFVVGTSAAGPALYTGPGGPGTRPLPGGGAALAVSDDGTVVAGTSPTNAYGKNEPCKWVYAAGSWTQTTLPLLPGMVPKPNKHTGSALAVAADGQRIAGHFRQDGDYYVPLVWDSGGVVTLESMLNDAGVYLEPGWYLADLGSMSPDGRTFGGSMSDQPIGQADSNRHAWVATVGEGPDGCGSFEHGFETAEEWNFNTHASWPASSTYRAAGGTANEHSGTYGLALSNQAYAYPTTDYVAAGAGAHTISVWNRGEMGDSSYGGWLVRVYFYDSNHQALSPSWQNAASCTGNSSCVSTTWSQRSGTVEAPAGTAYLKIRLYFYMADGWVAYDDVALDQTVLSVAAHGVDGGFETETGWSFSKLGPFPGTSVYRATWGTADQHSGSYGLALSNQAYAYPSTTYVAAGPGSHTVGAWVRGEMEDSSRGGWIIRAWFYDSNHQALSPSWQNAASCTGSS